MILNDFKPFLHLGPSDFDHIGGYEQLDEHIVAVADEIYDIYGHPLLITKGWVLNPESIHATGQALHLKTTRPDRARYGQLVMAALQVRLGGLGVRDDGNIHIDIRSARRAARWNVIEGTQYPWTFENLKTVIDRSRQYS